MEFFPKMALVPSGGWILTLVYIIVNFSIPATKKGVWQRLLTQQKKPIKTFAKSLRKIANMITWYGSLLYTVFIPLDIGTTRFNIGIILFALGIVLTAVSLINYSRTPLDSLVVSGLYKYSRNPIYVAYAITWFGAVLAVGSWFLLILHIAEIILFHIGVLQEEKDCEELYGQSYLDFKNRVPRYFGPF